MSDKSLKPEISIVIPAYNSEKTILRSLAGLMNQDILNCEIVVVNDGSTDGTRDLILEVIEEEGINNNIKLVDQENRGLGGARNTGIKNATSDYITFLDADDTLDLNVVKEAKRKAEKGNFDIVMFKFQRIGHESSFARNLYMMDSVGVRGINAIFFELTPGMATARIYDTNFLFDSKLTFPERRYHEDIQFVCMAYYFAKSASYIDKIGYNWFVTNDSITSSVTFKHIDGIIDSLLDIKQFLYNNDIFDESFRKFIFFCIKHINGLFYKIDTLYSDYLKIEMLHYLKKRIFELDIVRYNYFLWNEPPINGFIKNLNKMLFL